MGLQQISPKWFQLARATVALLVLLAIAAIKTVHSRSVSPVIVLPWFVPTVQAFLDFVAACVAFLALCRWRVLRDPPSFWIAIGLSAFGLGTLFNMLTFPVSFQMAGP